MKICKISLFTFAAATGAAYSGAIPTILNGSFDGTVDIDSAPIDWINGLASPDVVNASGPFNNTGVPWTLSPDGGTFVRLNGTGPSTVQSESIRQDVSGFSGGESYTLSFWATNLGFQNAATGAWSGFDGFIEFYADGNLVATSDSVSKQANPTDPIAWTALSVDFVAPTSDFTLEVKAESVGDNFQIAYLGIDGLSVRLVPAPGSLAILGLTGLATTRRRR